MPAAAVIPAPRAYINAVAFKKPVVGFEILSVGAVGTSPSGGEPMSAPHNGKGLRHVGSYTARKGKHGGKELQGAPAEVTVNKPECSRQPDFG